MKAESQLKELAIGPESEGKASLGLKNANRIKN
jgi:hypothetical protein